MLIQWDKEEGRKLKFFGSFFFEPNLIQSSFFQDQHQIEGKYI